MNGKIERNNRQKGEKILWEEYNAVGQFHDILKRFYRKGLREQIEGVNNLECREDDVIVCNFPKTGKMLLTPFWSKSGAGEGAEK